MLIEDGPGAGAATFAVLTYAPAAGGHWQHVMHVAESSRTFTVQTDLSARVQCCTAGALFALCMHMHLELVICDQITNDACKQVFTVGLGS